MQGGEANVTLYEKVGTPEDPQLSGMSLSQVFIWFKMIQKRHKRFFFSVNLQLTWFITFHTLLALKIWGEDREYTVSTKEEDIVSVDAARGILTARAPNQETTVSEDQRINNHWQRVCREGDSHRQGPQSRDNGECGSAD